MKTLRKNKVQNMNNYIEKRKHEWMDIHGESMNWNDRIALIVKSGRNRHRREKWDAKQLTEMLTPCYKGDEKESRKWLSMLCHFMSCFDVNVPC